MRRRLANNAVSSVPPVATAHHAGVSTVLGVGNPVMGDDAVGLCVLRRLQARAGGLPPTNDTTGWVDHASTRLVPHSPTPPQLPTSYTPANGPAVDFIDGGTSGMELLDVILTAQKLLVLDALTGPGAPGDIVVLHGDQIPRLLRSKLSPHQVGLLDLLAAARMLGSEPAQVAVVGVVAHSATLTVGMTPAVQAAVEPAEAAAWEVLAQWGTTTPPRV